MANEVSRLFKALNFHRSGATKNVPAHLRSDLGFDGDLNSSDDGRSRRVGYQHPMAMF